MTLEIRHLRYLIALAETGNFTRAAEALNVSQSTLSHQIQQLEDSLGQPLFVRGKRPAELTEAGGVFVVYARRTLDTLNEGVAQVQSIRRRFKGEMRVGASPILMNGYLPPLIVDFARRFPDVMIEAKEVGPEEIYSRVASGKLDIALSYDGSPRPGCTFAPLHDDRVKLLVSDDHPLAGASSIKLSQLHGLRFVLPPRPYFVRRLLETALGSTGVTPQVVVEAASIPSVLHFVAQMKLASLVAGYVYAKPDGYQVIDFEDAAMAVTLYAALPSNREIPAPVAAFLESIKASSGAFPGARTEPV